MILSWVVLRQEFQRSAGFLRSSLLTEIRQVSSDVDAIVEQNHLASVLSEVVQALQDGEQEGRTLGACRKIGQSFVARPERGKEPR